MRDRRGARSNKICSRPPERPHLTLNRSGRAYSAPSQPPVSCKTESAYTSDNAAGSLDTSLLVARTVLGTFSPSLGGSDVAAHEVTLAALRQKVLELQRFQDNTFRLIFILAFLVLEALCVTAIQVLLHATQWEMPHRSAFATALVLNLAALAMLVGIACRIGGKQHSIASWDLYLNLREHGLWLLSQRGLIEGLLVATMWYAFGPGGH